MVRARASTIAFHVALDLLVKTPLRVRLNELMVQSYDGAKWGGRGLPLRSGPTRLVPRAHIKGPGRAQIEAAK